MSITIEEGKYYKRADGTIHGPAVFSKSSSAYPWLLGTDWYTDAGRFYTGDNKCNRDLIAKASPLGAKVAKAVAEADIKSTIADEAKRIVSGARRSAYGKPEDNFERIARFWQAYFENTGRGDITITAQDVSPLMRLMKEARLAESPAHYDSFVDLVGYALTGAEVNGVTKPA